MKRLRLIEPSKPDFYQIITVDFSDKLWNHYRKTCRIAWKPTDSIGISLSAKTRDQIGNPLKLRIEARLP